MSKAISREQKKIFGGNSPQNDRRNSPFAFYNQNMILPQKIYQNILIGGEMRAKKT